MNITSTSHGAPITSNSLIGAQATTRFTMIGKPPFPTTGHRSIRVSIFTKLRKLTFQNLCPRRKSAVKNLLLKMNPSTCRNRKRMKSQPRKTVMKKSHPMITTASRIPRTMKERRRVTTVLAMTTAPMMMEETTAAMMMEETTAAMMMEEMTAEQMTVAGTKAIRAAG